MVNMNSNEPLFYPYSVLANICSGSCNDNTDPCAKSCIPDVAKTWILKYLIFWQRLVKQVMCLGMRLVHVNVE